MKIHQILKEEYFINPSEGGAEEPFESNQLNGIVVSPRGIFQFGSWREIEEFETFMAVGSGQEFALGAMKTIYDSCDDPKLIAQKGIEASAEFDVSTELPLTIFQVELCPQGRKIKPTKGDQVRRTLVAA